MQVSLRQTPLDHKAALPSMWASSLLVNSVLACGHDLKQWGSVGTKQGDMSDFQILSLPRIFFHFIQVIQFVGIPSSFISVKLLITCPLSFLILVI